MERPTVVTDAKDPSIEENGAHLRKAQGDNLEDDYRNVELFCVNDQTAMLCNTI